MLGYSRRVPPGRQTSRRRNCPRPLRAVHANRLQFHMTTPKFSLRGLLGVLTFASLSCVVLSKPSAYWIYPVPFVYCILTTCAVFRVTRHRWLSIAAGATIYILITAAI